ncbi:MAG: helix-turn-helix domain-containing protein [Clostridia bacterium]|nr:helix-turn-helix domain-containing protein [Clostridia bacterium]
MLPEAELSFFTKIMESSGIPLHRYPIDAPVQIDQGLGRITGLSDGLGHIFWNIQENKIYSVVDSFELHYLFLLLPKTREILAVGPYLNRELSRQDVMALMEHHKLSTSILPGLMHFYQGVHLVDNEGNLMPLIGALGEVLWGGETTFSIERIENGHLLGERLADDPPLIEKISDAAEFKLLEDRYAGEKHLMYAVSQGLTHRAQLFITKFSERIVETRTADPLRNIKNYGIVLNTLLRKSVEDGGVHPLYIDRLSSSLAKKLESSSSVSDCLRLFSTMVHKYCLLVKNHSMAHYSLLVQHVILRIEADLTADLSLKAHADFLNVNPSYLSSLFKRETGFTLTEYVNKQRVNHAIFLLNSTEMQIQTIAQYCGIPDVNYFTKIFKKMVGKTPKEYRIDTRKNS